MSSGWIGEVLKSHRLLLLDQRGAGLSTRVLPQTLAKFSTPQEQADYLVHFRADNIVRDAETIRNTLLGENTKWKGMGQSYGGFCLLSYLSMHPEGLSGVIITGGVACIKRRLLPPLS
ncbi:MAG: alpha/beta fold hydrolase [Akkermansiaceae bacterium]